MKVLSHQEYEFLKQPDKFNRNYQYVLSHRIKKKVRDMENTIAFINHFGRSLLTEKKKKEHDWLKSKEKWHFIVIQAMDRLKKDKDKQYMKYHNNFNKKCDSTTDIDNWNEALWEYQRNIVKLYLGEKYLQYEIH